MLLGGSRISSLLRSRSRRLPAKKKRTIVVGLKSDNDSREMLLRVLNLTVFPGDSVLAVHVQQSDDTFDPNTFHIHEDLCKSKQAEFQVKVCIGNCYVTELSFQVRLNFATILAVGCSSLCPDDSTVAKLLRALPPTCSLLVMDNGGKVLLQRQGTSQQGSLLKLLHTSPQPPAFHKQLLHLSSLSTPTSSADKSRNKFQIQKSLTMPSACPSSSSTQTEKKDTLPKFNKDGVLTKQIFQRLAKLQVMGCTRCFTVDDLEHATANFSPHFLIGEGGHSQVYRAIIDNDFAAAVKLLKPSPYSQDDLLREVEILSSIKHPNIIQLVGYCYTQEIQAIVFNLSRESLKQKLRYMRWNERMRVAIGVARALEFLHSLTPPIIHRDVKSSNILLSDGCEPQLSDFGAAVVHPQIQQAATPHAKPVNVVGTFGYLAPEYVMYGKVDEKIDVYSYGVVLLELITGKEAIERNPTSNQDSLVLWSRSLLSYGLCERLIDPELNEDYNVKEINTMMIVARLCLLHSSSRRPTMKRILQLFEDPEHWLELQNNRGGLVIGNGSTGKIELCGGNISDSLEIFTDDES
ncbi:PREDICTED: serine/threonine-protein kinase CDL1-like isoform X2 [Ipomoea nil]|uniref:serine/threonine-protein kinase CDL1-like isoform X2 n=1 Tax=Ipomoea nil TaxID=35883 RepID=UPI000901A057|nr:PREDICTED: serine/threonine-protein kinase CDL1-like isoform X2 [Ipomoea nil]